MSLTLEDIESRRNNPQPIQRVIFSVKALYGLSRQSVAMPLSERDAIDSGQICVTLDPDAGSEENLGYLDYQTGKLVVKYTVQAVFPGLYQTVTSGRLDPGLLHPVRATATDDCTLTDNLSGWRALGCLEFLPGSVWAGARGG